MRVFVVGGTGFIGSHVIRLLAEAEHQVTVLHRGKHAATLPETVHRVQGDRRSLAALAASIRTDVVIDMICAGEKDGQGLVRAFEGRALRSVVISSADVYRALDVLHHRDQGPVQPAPIPEDGELRNTRYPYRGLNLPAFDWVDSDYDKILAEQAATQSAQLPCTILRLPMVYGPGDPLHRFGQYLKQMDHGAADIRLDETAARWRGCWGYVENMAAAIVLAATDDRAAGRTYNVADQGSLTYLEWLQELGSVAGWTGRIVSTPREQL